MDCSGFVSHHVMDVLETESHKPVDADSSDCDQHQLVLTRRSEYTSPSGITVSFSWVVWLHVETHRGHILTISIFYFIFSICTT